MKITIDSWLHRLQSGIGVAGAYLGALGLDGDDIGLVTADFEALRSDMAEYLKWLEEQEPRSATCSALDSES